MDAVIGSTARAEVADTILRLSRKRMENTAILNVTGRDVFENEIILEQDEKMVWHKSQNQDPDSLDIKRVLNVVGGGITSRDLQRKFGWSAPQANSILNKCVAGGHLVSDWHQNPNGGRRQQAFRRPDALPLDPTPKTPVNDELRQVSTLTAEQYKKIAHDLVMKVEYAKKNTIRHCCQ